MERFLEIKVIPKSSISRIVERDGNSLKIKLRSAPDKGKANNELIRLLAKEFKVARSQIEIISGLTNRTKRIKIHS